MNDYRPSGSMCLVCSHQGIGCDKLDFSSMRKMKVDADGTIVVVCTKFNKGDKDD